MSTNTIFSSPWPKSLEPTLYSQDIKNTWNLITQVSGSTFLHNKLAPIINPAIRKNSDKQKTQLDQLRIALFQPNGKYRAELIDMDTPDGARIQGAFFPGTSNQAILFALGAGGCFEAVANSEDAAHHFVQFFREKLGNGINVFVINTRGIHDEHTTASIQGSALDYYTAWNFLESKKLSVLPWGHSLGFRYIAVAAAWKQEENLNTPVSIVSDRSFDDIANEAREFTSGVQGSIVGTLARYAGWGGDIQEQWNSLQGKKLILVAPEETTIPYKTASFYKRIQANPVHTDAAVIKLRGNDNNPHTRIYTDEEAQILLAEVNYMLSRSLSPSSAKQLETKPKDQSLLTSTTLVGIVTLVSALSLAQGYHCVQGK